jgi:hypothetical protein
MNILLLIIAALGVFHLGDEPTQELGWGNRSTKLYFHFPPDPINVRTLNFFLPVDQMSLPCFLPIEIKTAYNSYSGSDSVFGKKWTFNHNISVKDAVTHFEVTEGDGFVNRYTRERNLEEATQALVQQILIAQKKEDAMKSQLKDEAHYAEMERRLKEDRAYRDELAKDLIKTARPLGPGTYFSLARGQSNLVKKADGTYERNFQNGSKEFFNNKGQLTRNQDRNGNYLTYAYQSDQLIRINDMCGANVAFSYHQTAPHRGLVSAIRDSLNRTWSYSYDEARHLIGIKGPNDFQIDYAYDRVGNIVRIRHSADPGQNISMTYNEKYEVQSQVGPGDERTDYKRSFVANNQNHSITEITKFKGSTPAGRELHEFKVGEFEIVSVYDQNGRETSKRTKRLSPETGYPVSILDSQGIGDLFRYDSQTGNLLYREAVPSRESIEFKYNQKCNQIQSLVRKSPDQKSTQLDFKFDSQCNVIEATETSDQKRIAHISVEYTPQGKTKFLRDRQSNKDIAFTYWKFGKPESITLRDVGTLLVKYRADGELESVETFPHGAGKARFKEQESNQYQGIILREVRMALDEILQYLRPAGLNIGF